MPRRMVTSKLFFNEKVANLDYGGRYFFIGTITNADDDGRLKGSVKFLKANIFPYDNITDEEIIKYRNACHELGIIYYYIVSNMEIIMLPGWAEHQLIRGDRYHPSTLPPPQDNHKATNGIPENNNTNKNPDTNTGIPNDNQQSTNGMLNIIESNKSKSNIIKTSTGELFKIFESNFQKITELNSNQLNDLIETYGIENVKTAMVKAVKRNARNLAYVETILKPKETKGNPLWE
jgi:DnaD/phage-associated family protein